jgi:uncharacterized protein
MIKPVGPRCNLRCSYCYYLEKQALFPAPVTILPEALLENAIVQYFQASGETDVHFEWHGGEPTLAGLDFFRRVVKLQRRHRPQGRSFSNGLQTNGVKLDAEWVEFLAAENFSVGLSLDGPADLHDAFRVKAGNGGTHKAVLKALELLKKAGVFVNVLCVVHARNAAEPDRVYEFYRQVGASYLQFLPLAGPENRSGSSHAASNDQLARFFCRIFDLWIADDVGKIVIQTFDEALRPLWGAPHALCVHSPTCGNVPVLEHDGRVFVCDHFVDKVHALGNLKDKTLGQLVSDQRLFAFGQAKKTSLPEKCQNCDVLEFCNGGCPKDREETGLNRLCSVYQQVFRHVKPGLTALAAHMRAGKKLRAFRWTVNSSTV